VVVRDGLARSYLRYKTRWIARFGGTDVSRWRRDGSFHSAWASRHELMVARVRPGDVVVDLGSGPRSLERFLPAGSRYVPVDVVARGAGSLVCDLNRDPLPDVAADFVVMSGVLEYIHDLPRLLEGASGIAQRGVASYSCVEQHPDVRERRTHGLVNDLRSDEIRSVLEGAGWRIVAEEEWSDQSIFHLETVRTAV
jgi:hypothetical protein